MGSACSASKPAEPSDVETGGRPPPLPANRQLMVTPSFKVFEDEPLELSAENPCIAFIRLLAEQMLFVYDFAVHGYLLVAFWERTRTHYRETIALGVFVLLQLCMTYAVFFRHVVRVRGHGDPLFGRSPKTGRMHVFGFQLSLAASKFEMARGQTALVFLAYLGPLAVPVLDILVLLRTVKLTCCCGIERRPDLDATIAAYRQCRLSVFALFQSLPVAFLVAIVFISHHLVSHGSHSALFTSAKRISGSVNWRVLAASMVLSIAQVGLHLVRPYVIALRRNRDFINYALELGGDAPLAEVPLGFTRSIVLREKPLGWALDALVSAIATSHTVTEVRIIGVRPLQVGSWPQRPSGAIVRILTAMLRNDDVTYMLDAARRDLIPQHALALGSALRVNKTLIELNLARNEVGDVGVDALADALRVNTTLQVLDLSYNSITDEGANALTAAIQDNADCGLLALALQGNLITDSGAVAFAEMLQNEGEKLEALRLDRNAIGDMGAIALATALEHEAPLVELRLNGNSKIGEAAVKQLSQAVQASKRVELLDLSGTDMQAPSARELLLASTKNKTLHTLRMGYNPKMGTAGTLEPAITQALTDPSCTLIELDVSMAGLVPTDMAAMARAMDRNTNIETLDISGNRTNGVNFVQLLAAALERNSRLRTLRVASCGIGDGADAIFAALRVQGTLRSLVLSSNPIPARSLDELAVTLEEDNAGLRELELDDVEMGNRGAKTLAAALEKNRTVRSLSVRRIGVDDSGAAHFAEMLWRNSTLRELDLGSNPIADGGASALATALRKNSSLAKLALDRSAIRDSGVEALASAMASDAPALTTLLIDTPELTSEAHQALATAVRARRTFCYVDVIHERANKNQRELVKLDSRGEVTEAERRLFRRKTHAADLTWFEAAEDHKMRTLEDRAAPTPTPTRATML